MFFSRLNANSSSWYFSLIPINMAIGSIRVVITLAALSLGASLFEVGVIFAANALVTIVMSIVWGRLSDRFGLRKRFLLIFFLASAPIFVLAGLAGSVWQLIVLYTVLAVFASGIQPIAAMYAVEYREGKNWQREIVKYNSYWNIGTIFGLVLSSLLALVVPLSVLLYFSSIFCLVSALILWKTAKEPVLPLERDAFAIPMINVQEEERARSIFDYFDIRKIQFPRSLRRLKPIHLLFIACLIHWTGVYSYGVGEVPFMSAIGLSASMILAINVAENSAAVFSYSRLVPKIRIEYQRLVSLMMVIRGALIASWAALTVFLFYRSSWAFVFPLTFEVLFLICYALVWYPIMCFAISQAEFNRKGTTQGELLAIVALANVIGSLVGGSTNWYIWLCHWLHSFSSHSFARFANNSFY